MSEPGCLCPWCLGSVGLLTLQLHQLRRRFGTWRPRPPIQYRVAESTPLPTFQQVPEEFFSQPQVRLRGELWVIVIDGVEWLSTHKATLELKLDLLNQGEK